MKGNRGLALAEFDGMSGGRRRRVGGRKPVCLEPLEQTINLNKQVKMMVSLVEEGGR